MPTAEIAPSARAGGATLVLLTLAAGQFLMTLDSSVMNVSIATVAKDVGTTVTGIQGAITAFTLVMAALMITGAKVGAMIGRKRDRPAARRLRAGRGRGGDRGRGRPVDPRLVYDVFLLVMGVRRRDRARPRDPAPCPANCRRAGRDVRAWT